MPSVERSTSPGPGLVLHDSRRTRVSRLPAGDVGGVIWKEALGPGAVERIAQETAILGRLAAVPGVPRLVDTEGCGTGFAMSDSAGVSLAGVIGEGIRSRCDVVELVDFALGLARVLVGVHQAGVVHKDINPANIVVAGDRGAPVLIDWERATTFAEERPGFTHESTIVGTLAYLAPEQTGRTGRGVDQRADLYAVGATLYELATGAPPFGDGEGDLLGLIHDQLATVPVPAARVNPMVPAVLSEVIGRLLEKEPDRRYQSAQGLAYDLSRLLEALTADREAGGFGLGERDFPVRISAPSRPVGRDIEIAALRGAFDLAVAGGRRGVLVTGAPGVGKSSLIDELRSVVTAAGGWFVQGKFDQYRQNESTDGMGQALGSLVRLLLAEPEEELAKLRVELIAGIGSAAGVLAAMNPELGVLLDAEPAELAGLGPLVVGARLIQGSVGLLRGLASAGRPLVLVVDDLQWASAFPISFLNALLLDDDLSGVLLVGAYRDGEVDASHPLASTLARWERLGVTPTRLQLENLPATALSVLLEQMLRLPPASAVELAGAIGPRTGGNPYDTVELVDALRRAGALTVGATGWEWDGATIRGFVGQGDVVELLGARIAALPAQTVSMLEVLACLGGNVEIGLLAVAAALSPDAVGRALGPALEDGLLVRVEEGAPAVRFRHDRVQQAAHAARLSPLARRGLQLRLARRLAAHPDLTAAAAEQYLAGLDGAAGSDGLEPGERSRVVGLFRAAAGHCRLINRAQSERFLAAAVTLLTAPADQPAALVSEVLIEHQAALFDLVRLDEADAVFGEIQRRSKGPVELAPAVAVQVASLTHRGRGPEALDLGLRLLAQLGYAPPTLEALPAELAAGLDLLDRWVAAGAQPGELDRPEPADPQFGPAALLLYRLLGPAYLSQSPLTPWVVLQAFRLWVEEGPDPRLAACLGMLPVPGIALRQDYALGYAAAQRIARVGEARHYDHGTWLVRFGMATFGTPWFEPVEKVIEQSRAAREGLLQTGEWQYASFTYMYGLWAMLDSASVLELCATEFAAASKAWARVDDQICPRAFQAFPVLLCVLRGEDEPLAAATFAEAVRAAEESGDQSALFDVRASWALAAALFGDTEQLDRQTAAAMPLLPAVTGRYHTAMVRLLRGLALGELLQATAADQRQAALDEFDACRGWLAARAADAPANYAHLVTWLDAERAWALADLPTALRAFDTAITQITPGRRPWHAALIAERAARCHLAHGLTRTGTHLLADAREQYTAWGATGKATALEREFPLLLAPAGPISGPATGPGQSLRRSAESVDLLAVLQACQALSSETNLDRLRDRLVDILTAMTGATTVTLLFWNDDAQSWSLPATDHTGGTALSVEDAGHAGLVCLSAFRYAERTREPLLVPDATRDDRFARDPHLAGLDTCSLLVIPLYSRGVPRAMLHLENRLSRGVFTTDRLDAVLLLVGQLTVSLDNALAERFTALVQRSSELTLVANRDATLTYASPASADLLGIPATQLTGRPATELIHPDDRDTYTAWINTPAAEAAPLPCRVRNAHGAPVWVEITRTDLTNDPAVAGTVLHLRDVTERQRLENDLRHAQKMESVGQLSAGVAHEINTPIQFVADNLRFIADSIGPLQALLDGYRHALSLATGPAELHTQRATLAICEDDVDLDFLRDELPLAATQALDGTTRVATIVKAMKAFAHPGGEANTFTDLNEAIRNTLVMASSELKLVADVVLDLGDLPPVWGNLGDLNQAILNLIVNAAHAMAEASDAGRGRGTLTVRTRSQPDAIVIAVQDTGTGIPAEIADRVFEQFFTTKRVGVGTGQGLALAYTLIHDRHHGTLTFETTPGVGTTFTINLPQHAEVPPGR